MSCEAERELERELDEADSHNSNEGPPVVESRPKIEMTAEESAGQTGKFVISVEDRNKEYRWNRLEKTGRTEGESQSRESLIRMITI